MGRYLGRCGAALGSVALLPSAVAALGAWSDQADALTHLAPVYLGLGLAAFALSLGRSRLGTAAGGMAALIALGLMAPEFLRSRPNALVEASEMGRGDFRVVQFNVWNENQDPSGSIAWILAQDPDVVVLEEAIGPTKPIVRAIRQSYPYRTSCNPPGPCSTEILSRAKPVFQGGLSAPSPGETVTPAAYAGFTTPQGLVTVVATHNTWPIPAGRQQAQSRRLARTLAGLPRDHMVVVGDFNSTPWSFSLRRQDRLFSLQRFSVALPSWPARFGGTGIPFPFAILPIDQVYAGSAWRRVSVRRGPRLGSDHYPLIVDLSAN